MNNNIINFTRTFTLQEIKNYENISLPININKKYEKTFNKNNVFQSLPYELKKYHINFIHRHLCNINEGILFNDINPFDFHEVAKKMYEQYKTEHFKKLLHIKINPNKIYSLNTKKVRYYDELITYYLQCRPNSFAITCWDKVKSDDINNIVNLLKKNGNVYYIRKLEFTDRQLEALIYQIYFDARRLSDYNSIREKILYTSDSKDIKTIHVIIFDNINELKISGSRADFKSDIRNLLIKKYGNNFRGDDFIHINDYFCQTIEYAQIYFNKNSRKNLQNFNLKSFYLDTFKQSKMMFLTYKNWLINNTNLLQRTKFCLMSGSTLFTHGIRPTSDIDALYIDGDSNLDTLVKKFFFDENTKFPFSDVGSENWKSSWKESNRKWLDLLKIKDVNELILNPRYYYYFKGIKIFRIDYEIYRKLKIVQSPKTFADAYYINLNTEIDINEFKNNEKILKFVSSKDKKYYNKFKFFLENKYNIKI